MLAVAFLCAQNNAQPPDTVRPEISGIVLEQDLKQFIPDAEITIYFNGSEVGKVTSNYQGAFRFQGTEFGVYSLRTRKPGYGYPGEPLFGSGAVTQVNLDRKRPSREITIALSRVGEVRGRMIDADSGEPLADFPVRISPLFYNRGSQVITPGNETRTDSEGRFKLTTSTGRHVAIIRPRIAGAAQFLKEFSDEDTKAVDQDYERSYWPGGGALGSVYGVQVPAGGVGDVGTIEARKTNFYRLHVTVSDAGCRAGEIVQVMIGNLTDRFATSDGRGETGCGKSFLVRNLQPGRYVFNLFQSRGGPKGTVVADITDRNLSVAASLHRGADVECQVVPAEGARLAPLNRLQVSTRPVEGLPFLDEMSPVHADEKGRFRLENVSYGRRRLDLTGIDNSYYVKEVRYNDAVISNNIFTVSGPGILQVIVDDKPANITGVVSESDHPVSYPYVVMAKWPSEESVPRPSYTSGGTEGKFQFAGLAPGEYQIFAVSNSDVAKLDEPGVLGRLLAGAEKISLDPRSSQKVTLRLTDPAR